MCTRRLLPLHPGIRGRRSQVQGDRGCAHGVRGGDQDRREGFGGDTHHSLGVLGMSHILAVMNGRAVYDEVSDGNNQKFDEFKQGKLIKLAEEHSGKSRGDMLEHSERARLLEMVTEVCFACPLPAVSMKRMLHN